MRAEVLLRDDVRAAARRVGADGLPVRRDHDHEQHRDRDREREDEPRRRERGRRRARPARPRSRRRPTRTGRRRRSGARGVLRRSVSSIASDGIGVPTIARFIDIEPVRRAAPRARPLVIGLGHAAAPCPVRASSARNACRSSLASSVVRLAVVERAGRVGEQPTDEEDATAPTRARAGAAGRRSRRARPRCERTAPPVERRRAGQDARRPRRARSGRSTRRAARASSTLVSSPAAPGEQRRARRGHVADEQAIDRRPELRRARALVAALARRPRARTRRRDRSRRRVERRGRAARRRGDERERGERGCRARRPGQLDRLAGTEQRDVAARDHADHGRHACAQGRLRLVAAGLRISSRRARRAGSRRPAR